MPKRMIKPLMVWVMRKILNNQGMRSHALSTLAKYPKLKQHLRLFAIRSGLINGWNMPTTINRASGLQRNVGIVHSPDMQESINSLTPHAVRIYIQLKRSVDKRKN